MFVCRVVAPPQYGNSLAMAGSLSQSLAQNLGIQWDPASKKSTHETHSVDFFFFFLIYFDCRPTTINKGNFNATPTKGSLYQLPQWYYPPLDLQNSRLQKIMKLLLRPGASDTSNSWIAGHEARLHAIRALINMCQLQQTPGSTALCE